MDRRDWLGRFCTLAAIAIIVATIAFSGQAGADNRLQATPGTPASPSAATPVVVVPSGPIISEAAGVYGDAWDMLSEGEPGKLSVVALGSLSTYSVGVIIKNNTDQSVGMVSIAAEIRDPAGTLIGTPDDQFLLPRIVEPGGYAIGMLSSSPSVPNGSTATIYIDTREGGVEYAHSVFPDVPLTLVELTVGPNEINGIVENQTDTPLSRDGFVRVACFAADGTLTGSYFASITRPSLGAGERSPFHVAIYGATQSCPHFLVTGFGASK